MRSLKASLAKAFPPFHARDAAAVAQEPLPPHRTSAAWKRAGLPKQFVKLDVDPAEPKVELREARLRKEEAYVGRASTYLNQGCNSEAVIRALDTVRRQPVAIKKISVPFYGYQHDFYLRGPREEYRLIRDLDHPNVVRGLAYGERVTANGYKAYLAMALVEPGPDQRLGPAPRKFIGTFFLGLAYLHANSVTHGDLGRSENVLITRDGSAVIVDLGCGKRVPEWAMDDDEDGDGYGYRGYEFDFGDAVGCVSGKLSRVAGESDAAELEALRADFAVFTQSTAAASWRSGVPPTEADVRQALAAARLV
jgi:hypothetical protein